MALYPETVAIPVVKGINVTTSARLLDSMDLLEAENVRFPTGSGAKKRRGHAGSRIRGAKPLPPSWTPPVFSAPLRPDIFDTSNRNLPATWCYGYGYAPTGVRESPATILETSPHPDSGLAFGTAERDSESVIWDGFRLLSRTNLETVGGRMAEVPAVMPVLRSEPIAKANVAQARPDVADNGIVRVAAWISAVGVPYYSAIDSQLGTTVVVPTALQVTTANNVRCIPVGKWIHVVVSDSDTDTVQLFSLHQDNPELITKSSMGVSNGYFDIWKHSDTSWFAAICEDTQITLRSLNADGTLVFSAVLDTGVLASAIGTVALCVAPNGDGELGLVWRDGTQVRTRLYNASTGASINTLRSAAAAGATMRPVAIVSKWLPDSNGENYFNIYWDSWDGATQSLWVQRFSNTAGVHYTKWIYHKQLASTAFRVGDRTFIWAANRSTYQSTWLLLDESLMPVGHADYIGADVPSPTAFASLASVNWWGAAPDKDRLVYHCSLGFRIRVQAVVPSLGTNPPAVYSEPSIHFIRMDFLPRLRSAQAGRSTYFAGAQLWSYDGADLTEAGFHLAPEGVTCVEAAGGSLTLTGTYIYRIDLCYRNAQNEEVRSASFFTSPLTLTSTNRTINLTIPTVLTRRSNAYFLIFRNQSQGTLWHLVNSRDPANAAFVSNNQSVPSVTFSDSTLADSAISQLEQHPGETVDYLDNFAAPACEIVAAGRDRLWVAGGEVGPGQVYPSRLFDPGQCPTFHGAIAVQVDRLAEPITAIGFVGEYTVFFRKSHSYILDGDGPDNVLDGNDQPWQAPRLAPPDIGAIGPEGLRLIPAGLLFQSPAGIRLLSPGGNILPIGQPVDSVAKGLDISSALLVGEDQEVRFYSWDGPTLVLNYQYGAWSTWNIRAAGATRNTTGLAVVATPTGQLLVETEGLWTDNDGLYRMRVRFAWLHAGALMDFQRVRRIGALGSATVNHKVHVEVFYNERDFYEERFDWSVPDVTQNLDTFGSTTFGDGNLGDDTSLEGIQFRDSTWPWRRRLFRQKCSVVSVAIDDDFTNGEGFTLTALALEIAKKQGLDRTPWRSGTYANTGGNGSTESGN